MNLLPKSRIVKVEMLVALPISATLDQIEEWITFECGKCGGMTLTNPLSEHSVEAINDPILTDTGRHLHSEAIDNQDGTHSIRRWTEETPAWGPTGVQVAIKSAFEQQTRDIKQS